ncbi:S-adenosyl-L-methionine-dependent methyltransferase [Paraphoma chrysanthemicola]|nr:S-adenosyl-L-methionine-dependent methyltransferase [Paraphoma chrysanthemicola]
MTARSNVVETWYDAHAEAEETRLDEGRLEFEVTMRVIESCLSKLQLEKAKILDNGGGPGRYAIALAKKGHSVTLSDLSGKSLDIARQNADRANVRLDAVVHANALDVPLHPALSGQHATFNLVLCLGPLYHLIAPEDRATVIGNCIAMAKPRGYILLAYVTIFAHLRDMASRDPCRLSKEWDFYESYLQSGEYTRNPNTESYHVYPADLARQLLPFQGEVIVEKTVSCEGFLGSAGAKVIATLNDEEANRWVDVVMKSADAVETRNSADHLLVVLRKL